MSTNPGCTTTTLDTQTPGQKDLTVNNSKCITSASEATEELQLSNTSEKFFAACRQYAYTRVTRTLGPLKPMYKLANTPCPLRSEGLWKGYPVREQLLKSKIVQWLFERDTLCWTDFSFTTRDTSAEDAGFALEEPELVRDIGAWSADLPYAPAKDALLCLEKAGTVPGDAIGLVNARPSSLRDIGETRTLDAIDVAASQDEALEAEHTRTACKVNINSCRISGFPTIEVESQSDFSESTDEVSTQSDTSSYSEQREHPPNSVSTFVEKDVNFVEKQILPRIASSIRSYLGGHREVPATGPSSANGRGVNSNSFRNPGTGRRTGQDGQDGQSRKRPRTGNNNDDDDDDDDPKDNEESPPRNTGPMLLENEESKLACHFHAFDPNKYAENTEDGKKYKRCALGFKDSRELRDHHKKKHYGPKHFCSRCQREFVNSRRKAEHENSTERCNRSREDPFLQEHYILIGTERRDRFDGMKKPRNVTHEEHWYHVWGVLFPTHPPPESPYMRDDVLGATISRIAEDEIQNIIRTRNHERLNGDIHEITQLLRDLVNRIRQRVCGELGSGQHSPTVSNPENGGEVSQATQPRYSTTASSSALPMHDNPPMAFWPTSFLSVPLQDHYAASEWQGSSGSNGPSAGSQNMDFSQGSSHNGAQSNFSGYSDQGYPYDYTQGHSFNNNNNNP